MLKATPAAAPDCGAPGDRPAWYQYLPVSTEPIDKPRSRLMLAIRVGVGALAVAFVVWTFASLARRVDLAMLEVSWGWAAVSVLPLIFGVYVLAYGFALLLARMSQLKIPLRAAMYMQIESQLARYTPGKVGVPLVRLAAAQQLGVTRRVMASAMGVEALCFLAVGGALGLSALMLTKSHAPPAVAAQVAWLWPLVVAFTVGTLALVFVDRRFFPAAVVRLLKLEGNGPLVPATLLATHALYWATWALHGLCVSRAVGASLDVAMAGSGLFILAPIVGFLALVAPAGAGVREALLTAGLAPAIGATGAIAAAILSRMASVIADFGAWLASR